MVRLWQKQMCCKALACLAICLSVDLCTVASFGKKNNSNIQNTPNKIQMVKKSSIGGCPTQPKQKTLPTGTKISPQPKPHHISPKSLNFAPPN